MQIDLTITSQSLAHAHLPVLRGLKWILALDAANREAEKLATASPERLLDMGIRPDERDVTSVRKSAYLRITQQSLPRHSHLF